MQTSRRWIPALLALLLAAPAATAAELGALSAEAAYFQAGDSAGPVSVAWIRHDLADVGFLTFRIHADTVQGEIFEQRLLVSPPLDTTGFEPNVPLDTEPERIPVDGVGSVLELQGTESGFIASFYGDSAGERSFDLAGGIGSFSAAAASGVALSFDGIEPGGHVGEGGDEAYFQPVEVEDAQVLSKAEGVGARLTLSGDLTLEFHDLAFRMTDGDGDTTDIEGRDTYEPVSPQAPQSAEAAAVKTLRFVRLHLTGAEILIESPDFKGAMQWAGAYQGITPKGAATFTDASGTVRGEDGGRTLDNERLRVEGLDRIALVPQDERLGVRLEGPSGGFDATGAFVRAGGPDVPGWLILLGATGVFLTLLLVVVLRRRDLALADVETALEAGQYGRAARIAARILHRDPGQEGAAVARAVALSRAGRHSLVIREVESRLETSDPTDGVLHYVLGLAYLERGQKDEAVIRLEEAVRRTPELASEVGDLRPRSMKAPSGYA